MNQNTKIDNNKKNKTIIDKTATKKMFVNPKIDDFAVIIAPIITEKTMKLKISKNQVVFKVKNNANKISIKSSFERLFHVGVDHISIINVNAKKATRGGRYNGTISGYKKAIITIAKGETINLFSE